MDLAQGRGWAVQMGAELHGMILAPSRCPTGNARCKITDHITDQADSAQADQIGLFVSQCKLMT
jgi:hypothetical protein